MKQRSPVAVFFFGFLTCGIYSWYWAVKTKGEMNRQGESIPTAWIWLIPFVGTIWWYWKYSEGVDHVTHEKISGILAFVLLMLLGFIGQAIIQDTFNKIAEPTQPEQTTQPLQTPQPQAPSDDKIDDIVAPQPTNGTNSPDKPNSSV